MYSIGKVQSAIGLSGRKKGRNTVCETGTRVHGDGGGEGEIEAAGHKPAQGLAILRYHVYYILRYRYWYVYVCVCVLVHVHHVVCEIVRTHVHIHERHVHK